MVQTRLESSLRSRVEGQWDGSVEKGHFSYLTA